MNQEELLKTEIDKLESSNTASEAANILYNIIKINNLGGVKNDNYKNIKSFIDKYVESIKSANYGYDNFNYEKIDQLVNTLTPEEQFSMLQYMISITAREFPEHDRSWFVTRRHKSEIKKIIASRKYLSYLKVILLYFGQSIQRLLFGLLILFFITCVILLPAPTESLAVLWVTLEDYSSSQFGNHILNVFSLFADLENNLEIKPQNWFGLLLIILGKLFFVIVIVNFIFYKISDKISQK